MMHLARNRQLSLLVAGSMSTSFLSACHRVSVTPEEMASRITMTTCPPSVAPAKPTDAPPSASLTVRVTTEPAVPEGTEVNLRLDGNTRSTVRVDVTKPSQFSLEKGVYLVRVSLPGYVTVEGRAPLTSGCEATMTLALKKAAGK